MSLAVGTHPACSVEDEETEETPPQQPQPSSGASAPRSVQALMNPTVPANNPVMPGNRVAMRANLILHHVLPDHEELAPCKSIQL